MRPELLAAALLALAPAAAQRGIVSGVTAAAGAAGAPVTITVTGTNPCGAVRIDYGDGAAVTHPLTGVPASITHQYERAGTYHIVAEGMGNCDGRVETSVAATAGPVRSPERPAPDPAEARSGEVADRAVVTEWTRSRFRKLDANRDGRIARDEWAAFDPAQFQRVDTNRDGVLSLAEFLGTAGSDPGFDRLDANHDGIISPGEWRAGPAAFRQMDANRDGVVTRPEYEAGQRPSGAR
jgi:hypothetical protein